MPALPTDLRNKLERAIIDARNAAEAGARAALEALAVHHHEPYPHQKPEQRKLRNQLRAHARQLGDIQNPKGELKIEHLVHECAYEHWHTMLFARFLAENDLLIEPESGVSISLRDAEELAKEAKVDLWTYASRCAQQMLPQIFRPDDPLLQVGLANEHRVKLERLLAGLNAATFKADDALGWVYQFWQSKKKDQVNESGEKITGDTLPAVTQLFTEHYMVLFLLHNTIGAWHAGKVLAANLNLANTAASEDALRQAVALKAGGGYSFEYLRFVRGADGGPWRPAAGTFEGWPKTTVMLKVLDPCCGSGHFLIAAFELLVRLRMVEEGLDLKRAIDAVLSDNLFGLELDARCTQIAAFNLALAAWKLTGYRQLPPMHIACTGIGPQATQEQWLKLAEQARIPTPALGREPIKNGLLNLHHLFSQAPTLGSLINPAELPADLISADYETLHPYLAAALAGESDDDETHERAVAAQGMVKAADLLAREYHLVITNVPYLARGKQAPFLQDFCEQNYSNAKTDLGTVFLVRLLRFLAKRAVAALVITQNWRFQPTYKALRNWLLTRTTLNFVGALGPRAFETIGGEVVNVGLFVLTLAEGGADSDINFVDTSGEASPATKADSLAAGEVGHVAQRSQLQNPDHVLSLHSMGAVDLLGDRAFSFQGIKTGDDSRFKRTFWELGDPTVGWRLLQGTVEECCEYGGLECVLRWDSEGSDLARLQGLSAWDKAGVAVSQMSSLPCAIYVGSAFDSNMTALIPKNQSDLAPLYAYARSDEFRREIRKIDRSLKPTNSSFARVPFDVNRWSAAAKSVPFHEKPWSNDPRQYVFHGWPGASSSPLHAAVARLMGFRWPSELDAKLELGNGTEGLVKKSSALAAHADEDGIVCIPSVRGEEPAAERLLTMLTACGIRPDRNLDDWLRNNFFQEHCELFHQRPFIWHIWDGRKRDGFHALVNYHKLAHGSSGTKLLENLTYSYLGEWINRQQDGVKRGEDGAEDRLAAATELQKRLAAILKGEPPFDIFVRWKPLHEQPIGWEPDINDGVRMNIRPFLANDIPGGRTGAGVLRWRPNIKWDKDRGTEPERKKSEFPWFWSWDESTEDFMGGKEFDGKRWNDCHYSVAAKRAARGE